MIRRPRIALSGLVLLLSGSAFTFAACSGDDDNSGLSGPRILPDATAAADTLVSGADTSTQDSLVPPGDDGASDSSAPDTSCPGAFDAAGLDDAAVQSGLALILNAYHCYNCHQAQPLNAGLVLSGHNASIRDGEAIYPPNLTPDKETGLGC
jgi:hypothetical protein